MWVSKELLKLPSRLAAIVSGASDILVPPTCLLCDAFVSEQGGCCGSCWKQFRFIAPPMCPVMGSPFSFELGEGMLSAEAIADPPPFSRLRAVMLYDDHARRLVSLMKYSDRTDLAVWLAKWMAVAGRELLAESDVIVPVPLHPSRLRQRRYNQAAELARHVADGSGVAFSPVGLKRRKNTKQQVGLSESERQRNVSGAFEVTPDRKIDVAERRVLLIDDVYTTGATTKAATRALKRAGAKQIDVLVFAKVEIFQP